MFDYDVSTLKDFTFSSIYDVFALIAQNYPVRSRYDIESFEYKSDYLAEGKSYKIVPKSFLKNIKKNMKMKKKIFQGLLWYSRSFCDLFSMRYINNKI
mgnify:FL=1